VGGDGLGESRWLLSAEDAGCLPFRPPEEVAFDSWIDLNELVFFTGI
jgi:hypothetical protein